MRVAEEFEASGLTQREYAGRRGLRLSTLQSWVYLRRRQGGAVAKPPVRLLPVQGTRPANDVPRGIAELSGPGHPSTRAKES
nr:hypothetical protein [Pyxidicoccus fallax]